MKQSLKQIETYLAGSNSVNWRAFALTQPLLFLFGLVTFLDHSLGNSWVITGVVAAEALLEVAIAYVLKLLLLSSGEQNSLGRIWLIYWLTGTLGVLFTIALLGVPFRDPTAGVSAWTLILTNGLLRIVWFSVAHIAVSVLRSHFKLLSELQARASELSRLQSEVNSQLSRELENLRKTIAEKISNALALISGQVSGLSSSTPKSELLVRAAMVSDLCSTEVRALSHEISSREFRPQLESASPRATPKSLFEVPMNGFDIKLHLRWVAGIGVLNAFTIALEHGGWIGAISSLVAIAIGIPLIRGIDSLRLKSIAPSSPTVAIIQVMFEFVMASGIVIGGLWFAGEALPPIRDYVQTIYLIAPVVILIIWTLVQVIIEYARRLRLLGTELETHNQLLSREVSVAQAKAAKATSRIGRLLHGTTQGRLASVSLALAAAANAENSERLETLLGQAREQLSLAEKDLEITLRDAEVNQTPTLIEEIDSLIAGWRNLVVIRHFVHLDALSFLDNRKDMVLVVSEAMNECVTNAVRHGKASEVSIDIRMDRDLELVVSNDGHAVSEIVPGFGIRTISEGAENVRIEKRDSLTFVIIRWAVVSR